MTTIWIEKYITAGGEFVEYIFDIFVKLDVGSPHAIAVNKKECFCIYGILKILIEN